MSKHSTHPDIIKRLKIAEGHLKSIVAMLQDEKPCLEVAQQLQAVESAITKAKKTFIRDHIDHCLDHTMDGGATGKAAVEEFKEITKYL